MNRVFKKQYLFLAALAVALVTGGALYMRNSGEPEVTVTPENLKVYLGRVMQTDRYIKGGQYLMESEKTGVTPPFTTQQDKSDFYGSIATHICVDFLNTLDPKQIEDIRGSGGRLYYANLRPQQQKLLMLRDKYSRLHSPTIDFGSLNEYQVSFGRFQAWGNSCPSLQWYFPQVTMDNGKPGFFHTSIPMNW